MSCSSDIVSHRPVADSLTMDLMRTTSSLTKCGHLFVNRCTDDEAVFTGGTRKPVPGGSSGRSWAQKASVAFATSTYGCRATRRLSSRRKWFEQIRGGVAGTARTSSRLKSDRRRSRCASRHQSARHQRPLFLPALPEG